MGKSLKGKELGRGISQRKDGRYQARFTNRFGKRQTIYANNYNEIQKKLREVQYEDEKKINVISSNMTLDEWFDEWITTYKRNIRNTTKIHYTTSYNRLRESLGWMKLSQINLAVIQKTFNEMKSDSSRKDCKTLLVGMFNKAVESDLLIKNYAISLNVKLDNSIKKERRVLSDDEIELFYKFSNDSEKLPIFIIALNTGMRIGEITGLTWDCIDFKNKIIKVRKTLCYIRSKGNSYFEFHETKTISGKRDIPMTKLAEDTLLKQKIRKEKIEKKHNPKVGMEDLVFVTKNNTPYRRDDINRSLSFIIKNINDAGHNFEYFSCHSFRHTFATRCIANGMKPKVLQKILGHSSIKMTMDLYCHVLDNSIKEEMALFNKMA